MGKLDTVEVNGPEGDVVDWDAVDWRRVEDDVRRLRHRIFTATQAGDLTRVRNLQKLMLRSRANALCSVRRVTEINAGRKTAGVDGRVVLEAWEKAILPCQCFRPRDRLASSPDDWRASYGIVALVGEPRPHSMLAGILVLAHQTSDPSCPNDHAATAGTGQRGGSHRMDPGAPVLTKAVIRLAATRWRGW